MPMRMPYTSNRTSLGNFLNSRSALGSSKTRAMGEKLLGLNLVQGNKFPSFVCLDELLESAARKFVLDLIHELIIGLSGEEDVAPPAAAISDNNWAFLCL